MPLSDKNLLLVNGFEYDIEQKSVTESEFAKLQTQLICESQITPNGTIIAVVKVDNAAHEATQAMTLDTRSKSFKPFCA